MAEKNDYKWNFTTLGGATRVNITSGEDIAHLGELDQKLWTVLSCPVKGLEFDEKTLAMIDTDHDGSIRVNEIVAVANWLTTVLSDKDSLLKQEDSLPLSAFNQEDPEGLKLYNSAKQILANLGLEKDSISIADTADSLAIFAKTRFNGDGIITPDSTDDEALKTLIGQIIATIGSETDRSGQAGINADQTEQFYAACAAYAAWKAAEESDKAAILPYGDNTEAAYAACMALKDKIADYFMRCKLVGFNQEFSSALDLSVGKVESISGNDLSNSQEEIASYPLARVGQSAELPFTGINPAWQGAFNSLKTLVLDVAFPKRKSITEAEWQGVLAGFDAYVAWKGAKAGEAVESLGLDVVKDILAKGQKAALLSLIEQDLALAEEAGAIESVDKLLHYYRDFYGLLRNYVAMNDFYESYKGETKAVFQAGQLYIDQRCCDLCIKVSDMGKHGDMAGLSGMYILYCSCTSKVKGQTMTIAAVLTDGDVDDLRVGKNAVFYDRDGLDWDATITKIIENPISIRQAFWSPYKKLGRWFSEKVNKMAADKESKASSDLIAKADSTSIPADGKPAPVDTKKQAFDIAKFAGIFAAIGMAVGYIASAFLGLAKGVASLPWWGIFVLIAAIIIVISGPSMFSAWLKLRKRNLAPVLNANGWAINSKILVRTRFGATLTSLAKYPRIPANDPFETKKSTICRRWIIGILLALIVAFGVLYFTDSLTRFGLPFHKEKAAVEQVEAAPEAAEAPAEEAPVAEEAPAAE